jgi:hypothetical protein
VTAIIETKRLRVSVSVFNTQAGADKLPTALA